ncbi:hypothetical protein CsatB_022710 [Cannabis sativa]
MVFPQDMVIENPRNLQQKNQTTTRLCHMLLKSQNPLLIYTPLNLPMTNANN